MRPWGPGVSRNQAAVKSKLFILVAAFALAAGTARSANREIYPDPAAAKADLSAALKTASQSHKRIIVDFGGNWCGDCQVLDIYFHNPQNRPILESNFVLVHINIGRMDENLDIAEQLRDPRHSRRPGARRSLTGGQDSLRPARRRVQPHGENGTLRGDQVPRPVAPAQGRLLHDGSELLKDKFSVVSLQLSVGV